MRRLLAILILIVPLIAYGQEVDREELEQVGDVDIDFENYEGPHEYIDTIAEIRGIGGSLGSRIERSFGRFTYFDRYTVIHAFDPNMTGGLDADILILEPTSGVDHIDNVRRILSGYLEAAYGYEIADADLLAKYVTIYNAVVRGDLAFFQERYKPLVMEYLSADKVGLAISYLEWPGNSQIVIPLLGEADRGQIDSLDLRQLIDDRVIDRLREEEELGLEERREMVELVDRVIEEREAEIEADREQLEEDQSDDQQDQSSDDDSDQTTPEEEDDEDEASVDDDQRVDDQDDDGTSTQDEDEIDDSEPDETDLAGEQADLDELEALARRERERIAQDQRLLLDDESPDGATLGGVAPVYFIEVSEGSSGVRGQLVQINPMTGAILNRSADATIVSREYVVLDGRLLVVIDSDDGGRLALYEQTTLDRARVGQDLVYTGTVLEVQDQTIYAVFSREDEWYVGRFGPELGFVERSAVEVNPNTPLLFTDEALWVQTRDGDIVPLSLGDLSTREQ